MHANVVTIVAAMFLPISAHGARLLNDQQLSITVAGDSGNNNGNGNVGNGNGNNTNSNGTGNGNGGDGTATNTHTSFITPNFGINGATTLSAIPSANFGATIAPIGGMPPMLNCIGLGVPNSGWYSGMILTKIQ